MRHRPTREMPPARLPEGTGPMDEPDNMTPQAVGPEALFTSCGSASEPVRSPQRTAEPRSRAHCSASDPRPKPREHWSARASRAASARSQQQTSALPSNAGWRERVLQLMPHGRSSVLSSLPYESPPPGRCLATGKVMSYGLSHRAWTSNPCRSERPVAHAAGRSPSHPRSVGQAVVHRRPGPLGGSGTADDDQLQPLVEPQPSQT